MIEYPTVLELTVACLLGFAALAALIWACASGAFKNVERVKYQVLRAEGEKGRGGPGETPDTHDIQRSS